MSQSSFANIVNVCFGILRLNINIFGYDLTLWNVLVFGLVAFLVLRFFFGIMR